MSIDANCEAKLDAGRLISGLEDLKGIKINRTPKIDDILNKPYSLSPRVLSALTDYGSKLTPHTKGIYYLYNVLSEDIEMTVAERMQGCYWRTLMFLTQQGAQVEQINQIFYLRYKAAKLFSSS
jgi:hypothetical protein